MYAWIAKGLRLYHAWRLKYPDKKETLLKLDVCIRWLTVRVKLQDTALTCDFAFKHDTLCSLSA